MNDNSLKEKIRGQISEYTGFDSMKDKLTDQILNFLVEKLEGMKKKEVVLLNNRHILHLEHSNRGYNSAIADIIREVEK